LDEALGIMTPAQENDNGVPEVLILDKARDQILPEVDDV
jgi:hypothetical protein